MVRSVGVMPDGNRIISGGTDGTLRLWDIETGQNLAVVGGHLGHVLSLVALPDGRSVVSGDFDRVGRRAAFHAGWQCHPATPTCYHALLATITLDEAS